MKNALWRRDFSIVIPTIRYDSITKFLAAWEKEFKGLNVIVVEDNPKKTFKLPDWVVHFSWEDIDKQLGKNSWIISRRNAGIRCFGFLKAKQNGSKYIVTLDDDCLPEKKYKKGGFLKQIYDNLNLSYADDSWLNTLGGNIYPRGFPYKIRTKLKTVVHHGLWSNVPDLDGVTQKKFPKMRTKPFTKVAKIPYGQYFPMCSMNLAFRREILPAMFFPLMGQDRSGIRWGYDRFDDIWAGITVKKICDHLSLSISSGGPSINHSKASNVEVNIKKEKKGIIENEKFWRIISSISLQGKTPEECIFEIAKAIKKEGDYYEKLSSAMLIWLKLLK